METANFFSTNDPFFQQIGLWQLSILPPRREGRLSNVRFCPLAARENFLTFGFASSPRDALSQKKYACSLNKFP